MAYLYRKTRSPFWYVQYLDSDRKKHDKSTGLRADDPNDTAKARILRVELEANELKGSPVLSTFARLAFQFRASISTKTKSLSRALRAGRIDHSQFPCRPRSETCSAGLRHTKEPILWIFPSSH